MDPEQELKKMWKIKLTVIPIETVALGTVTNIGIKTGGL